MNEIVKGWGGGRIMVMLRSKPRLITPTQLPLFMRKRKEEKLLFYDFKSSERLN